jgi:hypothetical protein
MDLDFEIEHAAECLVERSVREPTRRVRRRPRLHNPQCIPEDLEFRRVHARDFLADGQTILGQGRLVGRADKRHRCRHSQRRGGKVAAREAAG